MEQNAIPTTISTTGLPPRVVSGVPRAVRNKDIMLRALEGYTPAAIAELYGFETPQTVKNILSSPLVVDEMLRLQGERAKDIVQQVKARGSEALETVVDTMRGELNSELRFKSASKVLDLNPDLQPKRGEDALGAIGGGMGEYIIRELAKRKRDSEVIDATGNRVESEGETAALVPLAQLGDDSGSGPGAEQPPSNPV